MPKILRVIISIAALLTIILPTDLLPDIVPFIGWLDDLVAVGYLLGEAYQIIKRRGKKQ